MKGAILMKKTYQELDVELIRFASRDVITTSGEDASDDNSEKIPFEP